MTERIAIEERAWLKDNFLEIRFDRGLFKAFWIRNHLPKWKRETLMFVAGTKEQAVHRAQGCKINQTRPDGYVFA